MRAVYSPQNPQCNSSLSLSAGVAGRAGSETVQSRCLAGLRYLRKPSKRPFFSLSHNPVGQSHQRPITTTAEPQMKGSRLKKACALCAAADTCVLPCRAAGARLNVRAAARTSHTLAAAPWAHHGGKNYAACSICTSCPSEPHVTLDFFFFPFKFAMEGKAGWQGFHIEVAIHKCIFISAA